MAAVVTAVIAVRSLAGTREDSRDRTRPVLTAELKRSPLTHGTIDLVLSNYGRTSARNVALHNRGCRRGLNPPDSSSDLAM